MVARGAAHDLADVLDLDAALALVVLEIVHGSRRDHQYALLLGSLAVDLVNDVAEDDLLVVRVARDQELDDGRLMGGKARVEARGASAGMLARATFEIGGTKERTLPASLR